MKSAGLRDWWLQRLSALLIAFFSLPLISLWLMGYLNDVETWYTFLSSTWMKLLTILGLLGYVVHVWIGLWVVITDYVPRHLQLMGHWVIRGILLLHVMLGLYLIWMF